MTTLQNVKDIIMFRYARETKMRQLPEMGLGDGEFTVYYEMVSEEIYKALNINDLSTDISLTPVTVFTEYALPASYGGLKSHQLVMSGSSSNRIGLEIISMEQMPTVGNLVSGQPNRMAIYAKSDGLYYVYLYPLVSVAGTLTIRYKRSMEITDGAGSGADLTKSVEVPRVYQSLLLDGILAQLIPDLEAKYMMKLAQAVQDRPIPNKGEIEYNFGGLEDDDIDNGFSKNFNGE